MNLGYEQRYVAEVLDELLNFEEPEIRVAVLAEQFVSKMHHDGWRLTRDGNDETGNDM